MKPNHLIVSLACVLLTACSPAAEDPSAGDEAPPPEDEPTNRIQIPALIRKNLGITFAQVEARYVAQTLRVPGSFELRPRARREYRMSLPGRVELLVDQYDAIEVGQPLFRFQSPAWPELLHEIIVGEQAIASARSEIEVAQAVADEARTVLALSQERISALAQANFKRADLEIEAAQLEASLPRLDAEVRLAHTRLDNAQRTREHALHRASSASGIPEADLEREVLVGAERVPNYETIDWVEARAEVAGIVASIAVTDGAFVEPPQLVLVTVDPTQVRLRALALQGDLSVIEGSIAARIVPPQSPGLPIGDSIEATMTLSLEAHPEERTMTLLATPAQLAPWIRPGVAAFLEIVIDSTDGAALAIPRSAIVHDGLERVFFRRDPSDPNVAIRVAADMGVSDGRWVALNSGVMRGDEVVLTGAYELELATAQAGGADSGHVHADGTVH